MDMTTIVVAASIPSAFTGFCFWLIEQNLKKRADNEKEEREERQRQLDEREQIREKNELCIINSVNAAIALGEATARAVQRIPDAHTAMMIVATGGAENTATQVTALIMAGASVVAYIIGEGLTDSANIGSDDSEE